MVGIVVVKTTEHDFDLIGFVITIGIGEQFEVGSLRDINAFRGKFKTQGEVQTIHEDRLFVGFTIVVGVFQDDQFIIGFGIPRLVMRITGHGGYPKPAFVVKGHLHGVGQVGEFGFGGKKFNLVACRYFQFT